MSTPQEHQVAQARHRHARTLARRLGVAASLAVATVAGALASGSSAQEGTGAGGTSPAMAEPPTAAEARAWEQAFLAREPAKQAVLPPAPAKAPGGNLFPKTKVLSLYGAAGGFGIIGRKSLNGAAKKLRKQVQPYRDQSKEPVIKAFDLVSVIATSCSGPKDKCRTRVDKDTLRRYHQKIREMRGRLILDIQPGRANVVDEIDRLRPLIQAPDVDVALDAEWNMGPREEPGEDLGSLTAKKINRATNMIEHIVKNHDLPPKILIVHDFREDSVKRERKIRRPSKVDVTLNFDGIGSPSAKRAGYKKLSFKGLFNGFSLFYELDDNMMSPNQVLDLRPEPDYVMYQ